MNLVTLYLDKVTWSTSVIDNRGLDNRCPGQPWSCMRMVLGEAGPDEFSLDNIWWTSLKWMISPRPTTERLRIY